MHPWDLNEEEARSLQEELAEDCVLEGRPEVDLVAGLDVSFYPESRICVASAVNYSLVNRCAYEKVVLIAELNFPYISGLLAFREAPPMIDAAMCLETEPDCYLVDGHGYAHPRRMGLASHIGLFLDKPTVGCAKNILVGEYEEPGEELGDYTPIWDGEPVGHAVRSQEGAGPIFLSPGHLVDPSYIPEMVEPLLTEKSRQPEPLRLSDQTATAERETIEEITRPFLDEEVGVFLVGGTIRDLLTGRQPEDYDLMVTDLNETISEELEEELGGGMFALDEEREMYRLPGEDIQVDLTVVDEQGVVDDLKRRDFTINSIALDMSRETWVDPVQGRGDADRRVLRLTSNEAIDSDPLRLLRAYRLAAEHDLSFDDNLHEKISETIGLLTEVSKERVTEELLKLAARKNASGWFQEMYNDGVVSDCPYFRSEVIDEARLIENWRPTLKNYPALKDRVYHGDFHLLTCFKMARLLRQDELESWPLHSRIKRIVRGSYEGVEADVPEFNVLKSSQLNLMGRLLGRGLWERWDRDVMLKAIVELEEYLEKREEKEKEIVEQHKSEDNIGEIKNSQLREILPGLWSETVGKI